MTSEKELMGASTSLLVLGLLNEAAAYGYELVQRLNERAKNVFEWQEGTVYPVLHRLAKEGLVRPQWQDADASATGRRRKYYYITAKGRAALAEQTAKWRAFDALVTGVIRPAGKDAPATSQECLREEHFMAEEQELSAESLRQTELLAKKISVAQHLDADVQAELRGHIEDKMRGYLSGKARPSEADALLLATAHFGEPGVIEAMFEGVYGAAHGMSLLRRVCLAGLVYLFVTSLLGHGLSIAWNHLYMQPAIARAAETNREKSVETVLTVAQFVFDVIASCVNLLGIFWVLRWLKRGSLGMRVCAALDWPRMAMLFVVYLSLLAFEDSTFFMDWAWRGAMVWQQNVTPPGWYMALSLPRSLLLAGIGAVIWAWWCREGTRSWRTLTQSLLAWTVFEIAWGPLSVIVAAGTHCLGNAGTNGNVMNAWREIQMSVPGLIYYSIWMVGVIAISVWMGCWARDRRLRLAEQVKTIL